MSALEWQSRPDLDGPILVAAFAGWNDAGEAATGAVDYLARLWDAQDFAGIDAEDFFDFTETRPTVHLIGGTTRSIEWPANTFSWARVPGRKRDVVFLHGNEPQLKWRTFTEAVMECARGVNASQVITLGGLLADVPHTRNPHVTAHTTSGHLMETLGLEPSSYEGPTGILGVVHDACANAGIESASLWVAVPHYVSQTPSPKAQLALVERTATLLDVPVKTIELQIAAAAYEHQVSEIVEDDEDMVEYVQSLEEAMDAQEQSAENLAAEAERFLRNQND